MTEPFEARPEVTLIDFTNLCNRRDSLQEELVIKMQEAAGA